MDPGLITGGFVFAGQRAAKKGWKWTQAQSLAALSLQLSEREKKAAERPGPDSGAASMSTNGLAWEKSPECQKPVRKSSICVV
ncbi:MAG: hypothetical protein CMF59_02065 [Leptospiraceae bacterium]|nr:hypothetical protein [Leptospiraceae bacterium]